MTVSYTSSYAMSLGLRTQVMRIQSELTKAQAESSSGQVADIGLSQGLGTARTLGFDYQQQSISTYLDTNQVLTSRLDTTNQSLNQLLSIAQDFATQLTSVKSSNTDPSVIVTQAQASLQSMMSALSTTFAGEYVFSGIKSDTQPVPAYPGSPPSAGKNAVDSSFLAAFGFTQSDPAVANISSTAMQSYLDNTYSTLFDDNGWPANFYQGSSTALTARVNTNDTSTASVTANDPGIRNLMQALTMISDLGGQNMNSNTFGVVIDKALSLVSTSQTQITGLQTQVGLIQAKAKSATDDLTAQKNIAETTYSKLTSVDPYQAATQVNQLTTQLQTAYSLTSRLQQLSLLQYLPIG
jgi:flagellar hook-associated protein 3 FlgL